MLRASHTFHACSKMSAHVAYIFAWINEICVKPCTPVMNDETLLVSPTHVVGLSIKRSQVVLECLEHLYKTFRKGPIKLHASGKVIWHSGTYNLQSLQLQALHLASITTLYLEAHDYLMPPIQPHCTSNGQGQKAQGNQCRRIVHK